LDKSKLAIEIKNSLISAMCHEKLDPLLEKPCQRREEL